MINWSEIDSRYQAISEQLLSPTLDVKERATLQKEHARLGNLLQQNASIERLQAELHSAQEQLGQTADDELKQLYLDEIHQLEGDIKRQTIELETLIYPQDPLNDRSVFLEIRAGTGGQEAALFAGDLARMYTNFGLKKHWKVSIISASQTDLKGFREVVLHIEGKDVFGHLKFESGVHRVQRVPATETQGRVHTSTATVAVLPEAEAVEVSIDPKDLRIDTYRAGGAGGQHVNKTDSAVRITHIPTGVAVACQDERSQHKNKDKAFKMLISRLRQADQEKREQEERKTRSELIGTGARSEKVRTYNFPQNRVTDHMADVTLKSLDLFMEGDIDDVVEALRAKEREERRKQQASSL